MSDRTFDRTVTMGLGEGTQWSKAERVMKQYARNSTVFVRVPAPGWFEAEADVQYATARSKLQKQTHLDQKKPYEKFDATRMDAVIATMLACAHTARMLTRDCTHSNNKKLLLAGKRSLTRGYS